MKCHLIIFNYFLSQNALLSLIYGVADFLDLIKFYIFLIQPTHLKQFDGVPYIVIPLLKDNN